MTTDFKALDMVKGIRKWFSETLGKEGEGFLSKKVFLKIL